MVDIWYPADSRAGSRAEYLNVAAFENSLGVDGLRKQLGGAYEAVKGGIAQTHAVEAATFTHSIKLSPVLIFSPGGGMIRELYVAQLEELASYGYVVAAISHPYDAFIVVFPDGRHVAYEKERWPAPPSVEGEANLNQLEWHADDIRVVLDELSRWNGSETPKMPFAGHLDLARAGAFGHSFGGIAAAHACQKDQRFKVCLNQDGAVAKKPFYLDNRGWGMDQAFMLLERAPRTDPPSDKELAEIKLSRERANALISRLNEYRDRALESTGKGSYNVLLRRSATTHMDFSDLPILSARDGAEVEARANVLQSVRNYTRAFFDKYLKGMPAPLLDAKETNQIVEAVQRFEPAPASKPR